MPDALKSPCSALFRFIRLFVYILGIIYSPLYTSISLNFRLYLALYSFPVLFPLFAYYRLIFLYFYYLLVIYVIKRKNNGNFPRFRWRCSVHICARARGRKNAHSQALRRTCIKFVQIAKRPHTKGERHTV